MSVIAWDGNSVAADRQINDGGLRCAGTKLFQLPSGIFAGYVGRTEAGLALIAWARAGETADEWPHKIIAKPTGSDVRLIIFRSGKKVYEYENFPVAQKVEASFMAWGSGAAIAMGALAHGASAVEAVEIAIQYHTECGGGMTKFLLPGG